MMDSWGEAFDMKAAIDKIEVLEAKVHQLEERVDNLLDYIGELKVIQPAYSGGLVPRNRSGR